MTDPARRAEETERLRACALDWLRRKGGGNDGTSGTFRTQPGADGRYEILTANDGDRSWWMLKLYESHQGETFSSAVSVTNGNEDVYVYVTVEAGSEGGGVIPTRPDPHCPRVVRDLLVLPPAWFNGNSELRPLRSARGSEAGRRFASELLRPERSIPFVAVSRQAGASALPRIERAIALDLAGLANVVTLDEKASWALSDCLGSALSCYRGAIRVYWPKLAAGDQSATHPFWTAPYLNQGRPPADAEAALRRTLRGLIFRASALGIVRPFEIEEIRNADQRRKFEETRKQASSNDELIDLLHQENDRLVAENTQLQDTLGAEREGAARELRSARDEIRRLIYDLNAKKGIPDDGSAALDETAPPAPIGPQPGETRFYKKVGNNGRDKMVRVADCGDNHWEGGNKADQARRGIARLERRDNWRSLHHCAKCTGGGVWKVQW